MENTFLKTAYNSKQFEAVCCRETEESGPEIRSDSLIKGQNLIINGVHSQVTH